MNVEFLIQYMKPVSSALALSLVAIPACDAQSDTQATTDTMCTEEILSSLIGSSATISSTDRPTDGLDRCRVRGTVATSGEGAPDGAAGFELNLPDEWNGKFLFVGGGGFDGSIPAVPLMLLQRGYATLGTDSGHTAVAGYPSPGVDASWTIDASRQFNDAAIADYQYRSRHQVDTAVRPVITSYYNADGIEHAYFMGCSGGGREALIEAQLHPDSYDGFIAGDPLVSAGTPLLAARNFRVLFNAPIPFDSFAAIDEAVLNDCDERDGVADGLIQLPALCAFDPTVLVGSGDLTSEQARALSQYLSEVLDTDERQIAFGGSVSGMGDLSGVFPGMTGGLSGLSAYLSDGISAEAGNTFPWGEAPNGTVNWLLYNGAIGAMSLGQPDVSVLDERVTTADGRVVASIALEVQDRLRRATFEPDQMDVFFASDSRLIIYHGLEDTILDPYAVAAAFSEMAGSHGGFDATSQHARLFLAPGMGHCAGGSGPNTFDALTAMEAWVEQGAAPDSILAYKFEGNRPGAAVERTMPLCPFPQAATYSGGGDATDAANWSCYADDHRMLDLGPNGIQAGLATIPLFGED